MIIYERTLTRVLISNKRNKEQIETIEYLRSNKWKTINQINSWVWFPDKLSFKGEGKTKTFSIRKE